MGITGFWNLVREYGSKDSQKDILMAHLEGKSLAIDANGFMYQYLHGEDKTFNFVNQFVWLYLDFKRIGAKPIFIFDGKPPDAKEEATRKKRREKKRQDYEKIQELERDILNKKSKFDIPQEFVLPGGNASKIQFPEVPSEELSNIYWKETELEKKKSNYLDVNKDNISIVITVLKHLGAHVFISEEGESEGTCCILNRLGLVDIVVSRDSDCFVFGAKCLVKDIGSKESRDMQLNDSPLKYSNMKMYDVPKILSDLSLDDTKKMIDFTILCGCDYTKKKIKGLGAKTAYNMIIKHKTIEKCIEVWTTKINDSFKGKSLVAKQKKETEKIKKTTNLVDEEDIQDQVEINLVKQKEEAQVPDIKEFDYIAARKVFEEYCFKQDVSEETKHHINHPHVLLDKVLSKENISQLSDYLQTQFKEFPDVDVEFYINSWSSVIEKMIIKLQNTNNL